MTVKNPLQTFIFTLSVAIRLGSTALAGTASVASPTALHQILAQEFGESQVAAREREILDRGVVLRAKLEDGEKTGEPAKKHYSVFAAMLVRAPFKVTHDVLSDYSLYPKMISYVESARVIVAPKKPPSKSGDPTLVEVAGGIWKYKLVSQVRFVEPPNTEGGTIQFEIVSGHFQGLKGEMRFESRGELGTQVFVRGAIDTNDPKLPWPPRLIVERGAEVVFDYTARKMRSFIEEKKKEGYAHGH